jgi:hypothetical protein
MGDLRIGLIVPEAAKARRRSGLSRPLQTRQRIRRDVANSTRCQHGDDVSGSRVSLAHTQRHAQWLIEEVLARHGDEELKDAIAPQHRFRAEPAAWHLENDLTTADEDDAAVGDDHACRQIDVVADEEYLSFPNDAVSLQRAPDGASRSADRGHIVRRSVLLFIAVRHALLPSMLAQPLPCSP